MTGRERIQADEEKLFGVGGLDQVSPLETIAYHPCNNGIAFVAPCVCAVQRDIQSPNPIHLPRPARRLPLAMTIPAIPPHRRKSHLWERLPARYWLERFILASAEVASLEESIHTG
jgi:hypothetical protein